MKERAGIETKAIFWPVVLVALAAAVFANSLSNGFIYDDHHQIENNPWIRDPSHIKSILTASVWGFVGNDPSNYYRPVMHLLNGLVYSLGGLNPLGYHLLNTLLHSANTLLIFLLIQRLLGLAGSDDAVTRRRWAALGGAVFLLHPVHAEVVSFCACLPELSFSFLFLLATLAYPFRRGAGPGATGWRLAGSSLLFFLSLLCKETAAVLPPLLLACDLLLRPGKEDEPASGPFVRQLPYLLALALYSALRLNALGGFAPRRIFEDWTAFQVAGTSIVLAGKYCRYLLLPFPLNIFHHTPTVVSPADPRLIAAAVAVAGCAFLFLRSVKRDRVSAIGWLLLFLPLAPALYPPVLGYNTFGEHYLYLSVAGFAILVVRWGMRVDSACPRIRRPALLSLCLVLAAFAALSVKRNGDFVDDVTIWTDSAGKSPEAADPFYHLGYWHMAGGKLEEGITEMKRAVALRPDFPSASYNIGAGLVRLGRDDEALGYLLQAVRTEPGDFDAHAALAALHERQGRIDDSVREYETVLRLNPSDTDARERLQAILRAKGR